MLFHSSFNVFVWYVLYLCRQPYCADRIEVYSGLPRYGSLRRRFCENPRTGRIQISSFSRVMYVSFKSDARDGKATGFLARFEAKGKGISFLCCVSKYVTVLVCRHFSIKYGSKSVLRN